jgi:hypothetical protein
MQARFYLGTAALAGLLLTLHLDAQDNKDEKSIDVQGSVLTIDKSTISVRTGTASRVVMFGSDTKFLYGHSKDNKPGSWDQVKQGNYISCFTVPEQNHLMAKECIYRDKR